MTKRTTAKKKPAISLEERCFNNASQLMFGLKRIGPKGSGESRYRLGDTARGLIALESAWRLCFAEQEFDAAHLLPLHEVERVLTAAKALKELTLANMDCAGIRDQIESRFVGADEDFLDDFEACCR